MDFNGTTLEHLSRDQCLRLVGQVPVGRIVYTRQALPAVELVRVGGGGEAGWTSAAGRRFVTLRRSSIRR
jgi:hypothetical protein